jgi:hypothetical protein
VRHIFDVKSIGHPIEQVVTLVASPVSILYICRFGKQLAEHHIPLKY